MHSDHPVVRKFIEDAGNLTQSFGIGRVIGQIYAYLYFSPQPRSLGDMQDTLGISKGSASMNVRQLEQWGAVQRVWVKGDRKDYYAANDYFGSILRNMLRDAAGKRIDAFAGLLDEAEAELNGHRTGKLSGDVDVKFARERVQRLRAFQKKAQGLWNNPLVRMMLK